MSEELDVNALIRRLKLIKKDLDKLVEQYQALLDNEETLKKRTGYDPKKNEAVIKQKKQEILDKIGDIDNEIIKEDNVREAMIANSSPELMSAIETLTNTAMRTGLKGVGITELESSKTYQTMRQLERTEADSLDLGTMDARYEEAKKLAEEAIAYEEYIAIYSKLPLVSREPGDLLDEASREISDKLAEYEEATNIGEVNETNISDAIKEFKNPHRKPNEADKEKWKKLAEEMKKTAEVGFDIEIDIGDGKKVKLSELSDDYSAYKRNEVKKIINAINCMVPNPENPIEMIPFEVALDKEVKAVKEKTKAELIQKIEDHKKILELIPGNAGKNLYEELDKVVKNEPLDIDVLDTLLEMARQKSMDMKEFAVKDPAKLEEKYKGAAEKLAKMEQYRDAGYDGSKVGEYKKMGITLQIGEVTFADQVRRVDFANLDPNSSPFNDTVNLLLETTYLSKLKSKKRADIDAVGKMEEAVEKEAARNNERIPRHIPIFSSIKRLLGFKTKQDLFYESKIREMIRDQARDAVNPNNDRDARDKHTTRKKAWELDKAQKDNFRAAERKIIIDSQGQKKDDEVRNEAKRNAEEEAKRKAEEEASRE